MSHWVDYLPEVGRPTQRLGEEQMKLSAEIARLHAEIRRLEQQHAKGKTELLAHAQKFWSCAEIIQAEKAWEAETRNR